MAYLDNNPRPRSQRIPADFPTPPKPNIYNQVDVPMTANYIRGQGLDPMNFSNSGNLPPDQYQRTLGENPFVPANSGLPNYTSRPGDQYPMGTMPPGPQFNLGAPLPPPPQNVLPDDLDELLASIDSGKKPKTKKTASKNKKGNKLLNDQGQVESTISQDQTGGKKAREERLLVGLAEQGHVKNSASTDGTHDNNGVVDIDQLLDIGGFNDLPPIQNPLDGMDFGTNNTNPGALDPFANLGVPPPNTDPFANMPPPNPIPQFNANDLGSSYNGAPPANNLYQNNRDYLPAYTQAPVRQRPPPLPMPRLSRSPSPRPTRKVYEPSDDDYPQPTRRPNRRMEESSDEDYSRPIPESMIAQRRRMEAAATVPADIRLPTERRVRDHTRRVTVSPGATSKSRPQAATLSQDSSDESDHKVNRSGTSDYQVRSTQYTSHKGSAKHSIQASSHIGESSSDPSHTQRQPASKQEVKSKVADVSYRQSVPGQAQSKSSHNASASNYVRHQDSEAPVTRSAQLDARSAGTTLSSSMTQLTPESSNGNNHDTPRPELVSDDADQTTSRRSRRPVTQSASQSQIVDDSPAVNDRALQLLVSLANAHWIRSCGTVPSDDQVDVSARKALHALKSLQPKSTLNESTVSNDAGSAHEATAESEVHTEAATASAVDAQDDQGPHNASSRVHDDQTQEDYEQDDSGRAMRAEATSDSGRARRSHEADGSELAKVARLRNLFEESPYDDRRLYPDPATKSKIDSLRRLMMADDDEPLWQRRAMPSAPTVKSIRRFEDLPAEERAFLRQQPDEDDSSQELTQLVRIEDFEEALNRMDRAMAKTAPAPAVRSMKKLGEKSVAPTTSGGPRGLPVSHREEKGEATSQVMPPPLPRAPKPIARPKPSSRPESKMEELDHDEPEQIDTNAESSENEEVSRLQSEIARLRQQLENNAAEANTPAEPEAPWPVLYRLHCFGRNATYQDRPTWIFSDGHLHLDSRQRVADERGWESQQEDVPFVVYEDYFCEDHPGNDFIAARSRERTKTKAEWTQEQLHYKVDQRGEEIRIISDGLLDELQTAMTEQDELELHLAVDFDTYRVFTAPYLVNYHCRTLLEDLTNSFPPAFQEQYCLLLDCFKARSAQKEAQATALFAKHSVSMEYMPYLFAPGGIIIEDKQAGLIAYKQMSTLTRNPDKAQFSCVCERIEFNGGFSLKEFDLKIDFPKTDDKTIGISRLSAVPATYAPEQQASLIKRGEFFHGCKDRCYVTGPDQSSSDLSSARYMVDVETYRIMHQRTQSRWTLKYEVNDDFLVRLPPKIRAYHMQEKTWYEVAVDKLSPVEWNMNAFESLAIDPSTKEVIQAVVTNKISAEVGTDLIAGKGNGLIVLLHGGPGTGKTLTAEGVAEISRKPLYRVTCGDIGTNPKEVEKYLESVFTLGRRWGCVVLLDEADVFLEQRGISSLERNALVSVFLRVLEYYDGILLITSNRVGTFDEAFKSRIQLAIHYKSLEDAQRLQIWGNFLTRLSTLEIDIDRDDIQRHIKELASEKLNGRQIRNVITTARQIAKFKEETLRYKHVKTAIDFTISFESYLMDVNDKMTDEERQREYGVR